MWNGVHPLALAESEIHRQCQRVQVHAVAGLANAEPEARLDSASASSSVPASDAAVHTPERKPNFNLQDKTTAAPSPIQASIPSVSLGGESPEGGPPSSGQPLA